MISRNRVKQSYFSHLHAVDAWTSCAVGSTSLVGAERMPGRAPPQSLEIEETTMTNFSSRSVSAKKTTMTVLVLLLMWPVAASAQLKVMISGGFSGAYEQLLPQFGRTNGIKVTTASAASQGTGPETIAAQLASGVPTDVVILSREGLTELIAANRIVAGSDVNLARTPLGVAVRAGTAMPDVSTIEGFKQALVKAKTVVTAGSTSGIWLTSDLLPRLGIADKVNLKLTPRGTGAMAMVAAGEADIAVMPVSEIMHAAGVDLVGIPPAEVQFVQIFSAAVVVGSNEMASAKRLIEFLASASASEAIKRSGMEPVATSK
jgi:molybdate transport system substrate-binding protein